MGILNLNSEVGGCHRSHLVASRFGNQALDRRFGSPTVKLSTSLLREALVLHPLSEVTQVTREAATPFFKRQSDVPRNYDILGK